MPWSISRLTGGCKGWRSLKGQTISATTLCHKWRFNKSGPRRGWMRSYFTCSTITFRSFHATMLMPEDRRAWMAQTTIQVARSPFQQELGILAQLCSSLCFSENNSCHGNETEAVQFKWNVWEKPLVFLTHPRKFIQQKYIFTEIGKICAQNKVEKLKTFLKKMFSFFKFSERILKNIWLVETSKDKMNWSK